MAGEMVNGAAHVSCPSGTVPSLAPLVSRRVSVRTTADPSATPRRCPFMIVTSCRMEYGLDLGDGGPDRIFAGERAAHALGVDAKRSVCQNPRDRRSDA